MGGCDSSIARGRDRQFNMAHLEFALAVAATVFVLFGGLMDSASAAQCMPDPTNPCKARCNGTTFDISTLFDYP